MSIKALDVSQWQGLINWDAVKAAGYEIAVIKMSGGDDGLYLDSKANQNYYGAQRAGLAVGMYHFAGGGDPIAEADYFVTACSPLAENDVMVLDWEVQHPNPVGWCQAFVNRVHERTGTWPLIYMNGSTRNAYDWTPVVQNCGVWIAWYGCDPEGDLPVPGVYVMHQYTSTGSVPGIAGNVDLNAWYGTVEQFNKYGYHATVAPAPEPAPTPIVDVTPPAPTPAPAPEPTPAPQTNTPISNEVSQTPVEPVHKETVLRATIIRALSTAWQAGLAVIVAGAAGIVDIKSAKALAIAAIAAAFSAAKNAIKKPTEG